MIDIQHAIRDIAASRLHFWCDDLQQSLHQRMQEYTHGELGQWLELIKELPKLTPSSIDFKDQVRIGSSDDTDESIRERLTSQLMNLHPWRKGPFHLFGTHLDTEWRSDWKWDRLLPHLEPLENRLVLDVGCGNGYHCWRMYGAGAKLVVGIDPSQKFLMQFNIMKHFAGEHPVHLLPIGIEHMPSDMGKQGFDTVFSMGVLYHRKSPIDHLNHLKGLLRPGGQLVLETLIIEGEKHEAFIPDSRYAQMRNVWFLPSPKTLEHWLTRCGFRNARTVDINQTTVSEQRQTPWMTFNSLSDYLDPADPNKTIEGYPAPKRAILIAET